MPNSAPFPSKESDLNQYFLNTVTHLNVAANTTRLGVSAANKTNLNLYYGQWNTQYPLSQNPNTATKTVTADKKLANANLKKTLRAIYDDIPESVLTSTDRNVLNLPARSTSHTAAAVPTTRPVAKIDTSKRLQHTIDFTDEETPTSKAKPEGMRGSQIWCKIGGESPKDEDELKYIITDTATPHVLNFKVADAKQTVYYWLRWENNVGDTGPWSAEVKATVAE